MNTNVDILLRIRDEATAKLREVSAETGGLVGTFQRLSAGIGIWGGIATGIATVAAASVAATTKLSDMAEQLERSTKITSVGIEPLQAMFKIIRDAGGDTDALVASLGYFKRQVAEGNPILQKLGLTSGSVEDRFVGLAKILSNASDEFKVARVTQELLGKTGAQLIPHYEELATKIRDTEKAQAESGEAIRTRDIPALNALDSASDRLKNDWKGAWNDISLAMVGPSTSIVQTIDGLIKALHSLAHAADDVSKAGRGSRPALDNKELIDAFMRNFGPGLMSAHGEGATPKPKSPPLPDFGPGKTPAILGPGSPSGIQSFIEGMMKDAAEQRRRELAEMLQRNIMLPPMFGGGMLPIPGGPGRLGGATHVDPFKEIVDAWNKAVDAILSSTSILKNSLGAVWDGLREGVSNVFVGLLNGSQTFASGVQAVFHSLGNSILNYLGTLVAAKVFQLFLKLVGFALDIPSAAFGPIGVPFDPSVLAMAGPGAAASSFASGPAGLGASGGNTIIIQTISAKDVLQSLLSPRGVMRAANDRILEVAAAS
jgi:hypothetical protein